MRTILLPLLHGVLTGLRSRASLQLEVIALRHQLGVLQRTQRTRIRLSRLDRTLWVLLYRLWFGTLGTVVIVRPDTVIRWAPVTIYFGHARAGAKPDYELTFDSDHPKSGRSIGRNGRER